MTNHEPRFHELLATALPLVLAASGTAQLRPEPAAGVGRETLVIDTTAATGLDQSYGCVYLAGEIFVSGEDFSGPSPVFKVFVLDATTGAVLRSFNAPANLRGGTTDGTNLMFVDFIGTVHVFDRFGNPVTTIEADNGTQSLGASTVPLSLLMSASALAFDPSGNGGNGSFFDNGDPIDTPAVVEDVCEHDLAGNLLHRYQTTGVQRTVEGLAYDPIAEHLWIHGTPDTNLIGAYTPNRQFDLMLSAGATIERHQLLSTGALPGGLSIAPPLDGHTSGNTLLALDSGAFTGLLSDTVTGFRLNLWDHYPHDMERKVTFGTNGSIGLPEVIPVTAPTGTLTFDLDQPGVPYALILNLDVTATQQVPLGGVPAFPQIWEFRRLHLLTAPTGPSLDFFGISGAPVSLPISVIRSLFPAGLQIRCQGVYLDPLVVGPGAPLPFMTTNEGGWSVQ